MNFDKEISIDEVINKLYEEYNIHHLHLRHLHFHYCVTN